MDNIRTLEKQMKALSGRKRLLILAYLKKYKVATVSALARELKSKIFAISQHLRILRTLEIVHDNRLGRAVVYRLSKQQEEPVKKVISML